MLIWLAILFSADPPVWQTDEQKRFLMCLVSPYGHDVLRALWRWFCCTHV